MGSPVRDVLVSFVLVVALLVSSGCVTTSHRTHPQLDIRLQDIRTTGILPPDVKVYEVSAGGVREQIDEWCEAGRKNVTESFKGYFAKAPFSAKFIEVEKDVLEELEDIQALYRAVSASIYMHTYRPEMLFPDKVANFQYSVGPIDKLLERYGADALIFVYGSDTVSTAGRKALMVTGMVIGAITGIFIVPRMGVTTLSVSIVDKSGDILWYDIKNGSYDIREIESTGQLMNLLFSNFPKYGQK